MTSDVLSTDVVIIGAGLSGLAAGKLLKEADIDVIVVEAQDRVGGRLYTIKNDEVGYVDLGGAYVGPSQNRILRMCRELGIKTQLIDESGEAVFYTKGRRRPFKGTCHPMSNLLSYLDLNNMYRELDKLANQVPMDAPWKAKKADDWDKTTMQQYFDKIIWTKEAMFCARDIVQLNTTSEPYEVSMLWFLWYLKSAGGVLRINGIENGAQERKLIGGSQQVCEKIAEMYLKDKVILKSPVYKITCDQNGVLVQLSDGRRFKAQYVILAVPPPMMSRIVFDPPLPPRRNQLMQRVPMGKVIKTHMFYKTPFWRDKGYNGFTSIDDKEGLIGATMEDVKADGSHPAIMGFVLGDKAVQYSSLTKMERKERIAEQYRKVFGSEEALKPIHYEEKNWLDDQWSGGCYTVMMPPGFLTTYGKELRVPVDRLHFASTETATQWSGYMDGAIEAGERAAREILVHLGKLAENEIQVTEGEDPEIKPIPLVYTFTERWLPSVPQFFMVCGGAACLITITYIATSKNTRFSGIGIKKLFTP